MSLENAKSLNYKTNIVPLSIASRATKLYAKKSLTRASFCSGQQTDKNNENDDDVGCCFAPASSSPVVVTGFAYCIHSYVHSKPYDNAIIPKKELTAINLSYSTVTSLLRSATMPDDDADDGDYASSHKWPSPKA